MSKEPLLPLSREQAASVIKALDGAIQPDADAGGGSEKLPRIPEKLVRELVRTVRAEGDPDATGHARWRARRAGAAGGAFGLLGQVPAEAFVLVEEVRAAADIAHERRPGRSDAHLAADVLVVWGLVDDLALAEAMCDGTSEGSLLDHLYRGAADQVRAAIPEKWTPISTLRFLWRMRQVRGVRDLLPSAGIGRKIPVVGGVVGGYGAGRDMKRFQKALIKHYAT